MEENVKPMLMQLAEPEYMCPKCGYKFYECETAVAWMPLPEPYNSNIN